MEKGKYIRFVGEYVISLISIVFLLLSVSLFILGYDEFKTSERIREWGWDDGEDSFSGCISYFFGCLSYFLGGYMFCVTSYLLLLINKTRTYIIPTTRHGKITLLIAAIIFTVSLYTHLVFTCQREGDIPLSNLLLIGLLPIVWLSTMYMFNGEIVSKCIKAVVKPICQFFLMMQILFIGILSPVTLIFDYHEPVDFEMFASWIFVCLMLIPIPSIFLKLSNFKNNMIRLRKLVKIELLIVAIGVSIVILYLCISNVLGYFLGTTIMDIIWLCTLYMLNGPTISNKSTK